MKQSEAIQVAIEALDGIVPCGPPDCRCNNGIQVLTALAAIRAIPPDEWQPIATAPKDAPRLRLWVPTLPDNEHGDHRERHGKWGDDKYATKPKPYWSYSSLFGMRTIRTHQPTHWQPLPAPPKEQS